METLVGIFSTRSAAEEARQGLRAIGVPESAINILSPASPEQAIESVPTTDAEAPGMGKTLGAYVGGVIGASAGLTAGAVAASFLVPGVGPVMAIGFGAAALLGVGGATAGAAAGEASERALDTGVPRDDVLFYRELLKQGRSLVIANVDSEEMASAGKLVLENKGTEDVSNLRDQWNSQRAQKAA